MVRRSRLRRCFDGNLYFGTRFRMDLVAILVRQSALNADLFTPVTYYARGAGSGVYRNLVPFVKHDAPQSAILSHRSEP